MTKILLTGATSYIGGKFVEAVLEQTDWEIYSLERLPVRSDEPRLRRFYHDLRAEIPAQLAERVKDVDYLVHFAADVSGAKSVIDPVMTVTTNVVGTYHTLELARKLNLKKFMQISTGEVVGSVPAPVCLAEDAALYPSNPYASSKAAAEMLVHCYQLSYDLPAMIVRSMNVFGPRQGFNRFLPVAIRKLLNDQMIDCHVGEDGVSGSRNWVRVDHFVNSLIRLLDIGAVGEVYHVIGPERNNEQIIEILGAALGVTPKINKIVPGMSHDLRYALRDTKLGFTFECLEADLAETAWWYAENPRWGA